MPLGSKAATMQRSKVCRKQTDHIGIEWCFKAVKVKADNTVGRSTCALTPIKI